MSKGFIQIPIIIVGALLLGALGSWIYIDGKGIGAPVANQLRNVLPIVNQTYDLGTTTPALEWLGVYTKDLFVSGTCTGCGAGGGSTLHVDGGGFVYPQTGDDHSAPRYIATSTTATSTFAGGLAIETSGFVYDFSSNNVGIGTASPQELLHVGAGTDASDISATDLLVTRAGPSNLSVRDSTNGVETFLFASSVGGIMGTVTNDPLNIQTNNTSAIFIDASQNVGIGDATPTYKLDVTGLARFTGLVDASHFVATSTATSTFVGAIRTGTTTPTQYSNFYSESTGLTQHAGIFKAFDGQTEHILSVLTSGDTELFTIQPNGEVDIFHTAIGANEKGLDLEINAGGFGDVNGIFIDYISGDIPSGSDEAVILVNLNRFDSTNTDADIMALEVLSTTGSAKAEALHVGAGIDVIHHFSGTFANMGFASSTADGALFIHSATSTALDATMFASNSDVVVIADVAQFSEIEVILDTVASGAGIKPEFGFSTSCGSFTEFFPTDATNGMRNSGEIAWELDDISSWATGCNNAYEIEIKRTQNSITTDPIENIIQIAATVEYNWDLDGNLVFNIATTSNLIPALATTSNLGSENFVWANLFVSTTTIPNTVSQTDITISGFTTGSDRHQGITLTNQEGYAYLRLSGDVSGGDDAGQIHFLNANDSAAASLVVFQDDLTVLAGGNLFLRGESLVRLYDGTTVYVQLDNLQFKPYNDSGIDLGTNSLFWDETYTDELVLTNAGTAATAANTVRLGGLDLVAGDAGLLITTENDTDHLFASLVGLGTTTPESTLHVDGGASATTTFELGDIMSGSGKSCFNIAQADGSTASFYFAGGAIVIETNRCIE
ncbi:MAG TPA: hypothetical protein ENI23_05715 [bacterium]|nr:hypothetical protein [bacterium]